MSDVRSFGVIREISRPHESEHKKELNAYLEAGWVLVDIHQRDYRDPQTNEEKRLVFILWGIAILKLSHQK